MKKKSRFICVRVSEQMFDLYHKWAEQNDKTLSEWIRWILVIFPKLWNTHGCKGKINNYYYSYFKELD